MNCNNENKRASVYAVALMDIDKANVHDVIGSSAIRVQGTWIKVPASQIDFSEKITDSNQSEVDLRIVVTDTSGALHENVHRWSEKYVLCRLYYTNCIDRVVGTDRCPVQLSLSLLGTPGHYELRFKGVMPEPAKLLQSF